MFDQSEYESFYEDFSHADKESFGLEIDQIDFDNVSQVSAAISLILYILSNCKENVTIVEEDEEIHFRIADVKISYDSAKRNLEERRGVGYVFDCYVNDRTLKTALNW